MRNLLPLACLLVGVAAFAADAPSKGYFNDFSKTPLGKPPDDLLPLNGQFTVREEGGVRFLEVSANPVDGFGMLFGPEGIALADVGAKIFATSSGKRYPEFGVGCGDAGGFKLFLMPGEKQVELRKGDDAIARADYAGWVSGSWTSFRLRVVAAGPGKWTVEGSAWPASGSAPSKPLIVHEITEAPPAGRASIWASPYSGTPVRFDDLSAGGK